jgi:CheY-like chemotaxis protein
MMGGRLQVDSVPGRGSTFHFTALLRASDEPTPGAPLQAENLHGLRVLVVDDNPINRRILEEWLVAWGMLPTLADGARSARLALARAAAQKQPFSLMLLDAAMPEVDGFLLLQQVRQHPALVGAAILMLSSADRQADVARCRQMQVARYLVKPVDPGELLECIRAVLGAAAPSQRPAAAPEGAPPVRPLRVLLGEDNAVNQRLFLRLLEKYGHAVTLAGNGREVLEAWRRERFDLILMDVQMPEMGGLEATAVLRAEEQGSGRRTPVVALTAHAMKGDRERCLQAGMDGYLTKPLRAAELAETLAALFPATQPEASAAETSLLAAELGNHPDLLKEVIEAFLEDTPRLLAQIRDALARRDGADLARAAHSLAGSLLVFQAAPAVEAARELESGAAGGDWSTLDAATDRLETELVRLEAAVSLLAPDG